MDRKEAIRLQQARADYIEETNGLGDNGDAEHTPESVAARFAEIAKIAALYVPHPGMTERYSSTTRSPIIPIAIVPGPFPQLSLRYEYRYEEISDPLRGRDALEVANEYGEIIENIEVQWIHGPSGYFGEPERYSSVSIPPEDIYQVGEVFAVERISSAEIAGWVDSMQWQRDVLELNITSDEDPEVYESTENRLALVEQSLIEYDRAHREQTRLT
jgi:hypothetical protein